MSRTIAIRMRAMGYYPLQERSSAKRSTTSIRLTEEQRADVEFVAELWNAFDKELEQERAGRKWSATSVLERLIAVGLDGFWAEVGGRPATQEGREEFIRRAVAHLSARSPNKKK